MSTRKVEEKLGPLFEHLDGLTRRAEVGELTAQLDSLDVCADDLDDYVRFGEDRYRRTLVRQGPWYHGLVVCWRSGQRSPIHNHAGSTCGVRVLTGVATETVFAMTPSRLIKPASSTDLRAPGTSVSSDRFIHQVSNLQAPGCDLITLHVYSPPLLRMDTYSLTDATIGEFRPMVLEHALGSGI